LQGDYRRLTTDADIVAAGVAALRNGMIIAVKGVGGYQLLADPSNQATVDRLRKHKQRPKKPFAIMVLDMCAAGKIADFGDLARTALISPAAPIIVVQKRSTNSAGQSDIPDRDTGQDVLRPAGSNTKWLEWVAPDIGTVGVMLPSSSLYFLIASGFSGPLIVTSANLHADPIIYLDDNASREIPGLADLIISHNREIILPLEDSVVQIVLNTSQVLRAGRGYAPMEFRSGKMFGQPSSKVGFGADQRNAPSFFFNGSYYLGPYVGAMTSDAAVERAELVRNHFLRQIGDKKSIAVCDLQQNYRSSLAAEDSGWPLQKIQHHIAHGMATAAEHQIEPPFSAVVWDGFGAGTDGKLWGGEFFAVNTNSVSRYGSLLPFRLLAVGANAISPRLAGIALLAQTFPKDWVDLSNQLGLFDGPAEIQVLRSRVEFPARSVSTSSAGRLIDGIGAVLGLCRESVYEAYAGIVLNEYVPLDQSPIPISVLQDKDILLLDWRPIIEEAVALRFGGGEVSEFASRVWYSLAAGIQKVIESAGHRQVVLSGGCFHGPSLLTAVVNLLRSHHFSVAWPEKVPAGDGGIAFGQVVASNFLERQELG
jgi:hydrogenase maturation protein HypF